MRCISTKRYPFELMGLNKIIRKACDERWDYGDF
jgi:hypothetical protein